MKTQPKIKKSYQNAIDKVRELGFKEPQTNEKRTNPFSGVSCELEPLAVMLYDFITVRNLTCGIHYTKQTWDNARYCFATLWPDEYYKLID